MTEPETVTLDDGGAVPSRLDGLLLPQDQQLTQALAAHLPAPGARAKAFVARLVLRELRRVFPQSLVDVLETGVRGHTALQDAARSTLAAGSTEADVALFQRKLHTTHTVTVDVIATLVRFQVEALLAVDFTVMDATADVARGRLEALRMRDPRVTGELSARVDSVETGPLCHRDGTLRLGRELRFDPPRQILSDDEEKRVTRLTPT